jgi:hypothetical protein
VSKQPSFQAKSFAITPFHTPLLYGSGRKQSFKRTRPGQVPHKSANSQNYLVAMLRRTTITGTYTQPTACVPQVPSIEIGTLLERQAD